MRTLPPTLSGDSRDLPVVESRAKGAVRGTESDPKDWTEGVHGTAKARWLASESDGQAAYPTRIHGGIKDETAKVHVGVGGRQRTSGHSRHRGCR